MKLFYELVRHIGSHTFKELRKKAERDRALGIAPKTAEEKEEEKDKEDLRMIDLNVDNKVKLVSDLNELDIPIPKYLLNEIDSLERERKAFLTEQRWKKKAKNIKDILLILLFIILFILFCKYINIE